MCANIRDLIFVRLGILFLLPLILGCPAISIMMERVGRLLVVTIIIFSLDRMMVMDMLLTVLLLLPMHRKPRMLDCLDM